jgi:hypothetical protein
MLVKNFKRHCKNCHNSVDSQEKYEKLLLKFKENPDSHCERDLGKSSNGNLLKYILQFEIENFFHILPFSKNFIFSPKFKVPPPLALALRAATAKHSQNQPINLYNLALISCEISRSRINSIHMSDIYL